MQEDYGKIIAQNIRRIAWESQKTQADIARDLNLKQATVSSWMNGTRIPRMGKIDLLCHYFIRYNANHVFCQRQADDFQFI